MVRLSPSSLKSFTVSSIANTFTTAVSNSKIHGVTDKSRERTIPIRACPELKPEVPSRTSDL